MLPVVGASSSSASMAAGSKASARRSRLGFTPSIQIDVGIDVEERRLAKQRQRLDHRAAGAEQQAALVGDDDLRFGARGEMPLELFGEVMHVDHRALDARFRQAVEHVIDQRLAADLDQGLRHVAR